VLGPGGGKELKAFARIGAVGIHLAVATVVGLLGGYWLDGKLGTSPYLTVAGLLLGVVAGFRNLIREARSATRDQAQDGNTQRDDGTDDG